MYYQREQLMRIFQKGVQLTISIEKNWLEGCKFWVAHGRLGEGSMRTFQEWVQKLMTGLKILGRTWTPRGRMNEQLISEVENCVPHGHLGMGLEDFAEI